MREGRRMREGRIAEPVWKRSVRKRIKNRRAEIRQGAGLGRAGSILSVEEGGMAVTAEAALLTSLLSGSDLSARILLHRAVNGCAAMGAEPVAVQFQLLCPTDFTEPDLRNLIGALEEEAKRLGVSLLPGRIEAALAVKLPYLTLNGIGTRKQTGQEYLSGQTLGDDPERNNDQVLHAGQDLLVTKWIAMEASIQLAAIYEKELLQRFTPVFVSHVQAFFQHISTVPEAKTALEHHAAAVLPIEEGGIFGALWELAEDAGLGLEADAGAIPVKQETIEICELLHKNPYQLPSAGSLLIAAKEGEHLRQKLQAKGIPAVMIGRLTEGRDRVLFHGEEKRFLELPYYYGLFGEKEE